MLTKISKIVQKKQEGFARKPIRAAYICNQAKIIVGSLLGENSANLAYKFKHNTLLISAPHGLITDLNMSAEQIMRLLNNRLKDALIKKIKIRSV